MAELPPRYSVSGHTITIYYYEGSSPPDSLEIHHYGRKFYYRGGKLYDAGGSIVSGYTVRVVPWGYATNLPSLGDAAAIEGAPVHCWPHLGTTAPALSMHLDAMRWIRVTAHLECSGVPTDGTIDIPLLDANNQPFLDPSLPPAIMSIRTEFSSTDFVTNPGNGSAAWSDQNCFMRFGSGSHGTAEPVAQAYLRPATTPVPHWVLRLTHIFENVTPIESNVMVDLVGTGFGIHPDATVEVGSGGVPGHYQIWVMWTQQAFNSAGAFATFNNRMLEMGSIHIADGAVGTIYLTTGANQGLVTGTSNLGLDDDDIPAVMVHGHATLATDVSGSAVSNWIPETWGAGLTGAISLAANGREKMFWSILQLNGGKWRLQITNAQTGAAPAAAYNRTFFVFVAGRP